jgi:predicted esterase
MSRSTFGLHQGQPVHMAGAPLDQAQAALILVHGRGATADSILTLAHQLDQPDFAYLAPQALGNTWYPYSFLAPLDQNEPALSSALMMLETLVDYLNGAGLPPEQTMLLGFSQGACLALEFVARHARRYGGVAGLSGGLIGPDGAPRDYPGSLDGTPIFLGCSDNDPHIPQQRVQHSTKVLRQLGGQVTERLYPGLGHTVNEDELEQVQAIMAKLVGIKS